MQERYNHPSKEYDNFNKEKGKDILTETKRIYSLISEMDQNKYSSMTQPIKAYIKVSLEDDGNIMPNRIEYLEKIVNKLYYGEYTKLQEVKNLREDDPIKRKYFKIQFEGISGYKGIINYIEFWKDNKTTWHTSKGGGGIYGGGYTCTCSHFPEWLFFDKPEKWENIYNDRDPNYDTEIFTDKAETKIQGLDVIIYHTQRKHETGGDEWYEFRFFSEEDCNKFSEFIYKKEQEEQLPSDFKMEYIRSKTEKSILFEWKKFSLIDKKYCLLDIEGYNSTYDNYKIKDAFNESDWTYGRGYPLFDNIDAYNFFSKNLEIWGEIRLFSLRNAVRIYIEDVEKQLYLLTQNAVDASKKSKGDNFKNDYELDVYLKNERYKAINWSIIEELLKENENAILEMAKQIELNPYTIKK